MRLTRIEKLSETLNKPVDVCTKMLASKGISVFDGYYDAVLYEAVMAEGPALQRKRIDWGLSPRLGLGMVKSVLEPLGVHISIHDPKGPQWLMLRKGSSRSYVKWYYKNSWGKKSNKCNFQVRGFISDKAPDYYLFTCFEAEQAWVIPKNVLLRHHKNLTADNKATEDSMFALAKGKEAHPVGAIQIRFTMGAASYDLKEAKQLGF